MPSWDEFAAAAPQAPAAGKVSASEFFTGKKEEPKEPGAYKLPGGDILIGAPRAALIPGLSPQEKAELKKQQELHPRESLSKLEERTILQMRNPEEAFGHVMTLIKDKSLAANLYNAYQKGVFKKPISELVKIGKDEITGIKPLDVLKGLWKEAVKDPSGTLGKFLDGLLADPELAAVPVGVGGKLATAAAKLGRVAKITGRAAEGAISGAAVTGAVDIAAQLSEQGYVNPKQLAENMIPGAAIGAAGHAVFGGEGVRAQEGKAALLGEHKATAEPTGIEPIGPAEFTGPPTPTKFTTPLDLQSRIDEALGITAKPTAAERKVRLAQIKKAFADNKDRADYLKQTAEAKVAETEYKSREQSWKEEQEAHARWAEYTRDKNNISGEDANAIMRKPAFLRTPEERIRLRQWNKQSGAANAKLLARLAAVGLGGVVGATLDPDHPIQNAIWGAFIGLGLTTINPLAAARKVADAFKPSEGLRVTELGNAHEHAVERAGRTVWQLQNRIEGLVPDPVRRAKIAESIEDPSVQLTPQEVEARGLAQEFFGEIGKKGTEAGVLDGTLENYVTHLWKWGDQRPEAIEALLKQIAPSRGRGPSMSPYSPFAEARKIFSFKQGEQIGLKPLTKDISHIVGIYGNSMARSIENKNLLDALKTQVGPQGERYMLKASDPNSLGYRTLHHPQLLGWKVHPDILPSLKFMFDTAEPGPWMKGALALNIATKRAAVSFSLFHAKALTDAFIGAGGNPLDIPGMLSGSNKFLKQLRDGGQGDIVDKALGGGLKISYERLTPTVGEVGEDFYGGMQFLREKMDQMLPGIGGKAMDKLISANHKVDTLMWGRLHAGMKLTIFSKELEKIMLKNAEAIKKNPAIKAISEKEAAEIAANYANDIFGGLNWRRVAESVDARYGRELALAAFAPSGRRFLQVMMFAPDWTISTTRAAIKAFGGGLKGTELSRLHRMYMLRSAIYYGVVADAINVAMTGHHVWDNKDPTMIELGDGRTMQFSKHFMEPIHWLTKPAQQALNKLGYVPRELLEQALGTEYLSAAGHAPPMKSRLGHLAQGVVPIWAQQGYDQSLSEGLASKALSFAGMPIYGRTYEERERQKWEKRIQKALEGSGFKGAM